MLWLGKQTRQLDWRQMARCMWLTICLFGTACSTTSKPQDSNISVQDRAEVVDEQNLTNDSIGSEDTLDWPDTTVTNTSVPCVLTETIPASSEPINLWWWQGESALQVEIHVEDLSDGCRLDVTLPEVGLSVTEDHATHTLTLTVDTHLLPSGRYQLKATIAPTSPFARDVILDVRLFKHSASPSSKKVLVVGLDGIRADGKVKAYTPHMDFLNQHAAYSDNAHTQMKGITKSGPGWASVLLGVDTDKHGVTSNDNDDIEDHTAGYPTFLDRAHMAGLKVAAAIHWAPILLLTDSESLDSASLGNDETVTDEMTAFLSSGSYDVHFAHLDDVDAAGHDTGFSADNPDYITAIEHVDGYLGKMLDAILARPEIAHEDWLVVVTTDHGGSGTGHGSMDHDNQTIFIIAAGASIKPEKLPDNNASHMDVHPTVMAFLGYFPAPDWKLDGQVIGL